MIFHFYSTGGQEIEFHEILFCKIVQEIGKALGGYVRLGVKLGKVRLSQRKKTRNNNPLGSLGPFRSPEQLCSILYKLSISSKTIISIS